MKTFTQSAFVRVENPSQRKELCEWLENIGHKRVLVSCLSPNYDNDDEEVVSCQVNGQYYLIADKHASMLLNMDIGFIDCGTNTAMFCALAAIREDSDYRQWFVTPGGCWRICSCRSWSDDRTLSAVWHKATPDEIVEHFKD